VEEDERRLIEVLNKIDLLEPDVRKAMLARNKVASRMLTGEQISVSAALGDGLDALLDSIDRLLGAQERTMRLALALDDGAGLAWAYAHGRVLERRDTDKAVYLVISGDETVVDRFERRFPKQLTIIEPNQRRRAISS
jgi:GTP-binding protein HflX